MEVNDFFYIKRQTEIQINKTIRYPIIPVTVSHTLNKNKIKQSQTTSVREGVDKSVPYLLQVRMII